jgi:preprotein translocase subunit YajC
MQKNKIISLIVAFIVVAGIAYYAGTKSVATPARPARTANFSMASSTARGGRGMFGGGVSGQILSIDTNSLTIKSQDGGSRIVFLIASTTINKISAGSVKDLTVGTNVSVNGSNNTDNSINAQMIQIRPF